MKGLKQLAKKLWQDESGQGATEYILLLVVVVALAFIFRDRITQAVQTRVNELGGSIESFTGGN